MDGLAYVLGVLVLVGAGAWAYSRYRAHTAAADAKSRAALNRLLAEADEIEQQRLRDTGLLDEVDGSSESADG